MVDASDVLLHSKDSDKTERIIFPITRYSNIVSAPRVLTYDMKIDKAADSPFLLLQTDSVTIDEDMLNEMTKYRLTGRR